MARIPFFRTHSRYREMADAYLDGELPAGDLARFEAHRSACAECSAIVDAGRLLKESLATVPMVEAPRSFRLTPAMVEAKAPATKAAATSPLLVVARFGAAASVAAFGVVGTLQLSSPSSDGDATTAASPMYEFTTQGAPETDDGAQGGGSANSNDGGAAGAATESPQLAPPASAEISGAGVDGDMNATPGPSEGTMSDASPESGGEDAGDASRNSTDDLDGETYANPEATAIRALPEESAGSDYGPWLVVLGGASIVSVGALGTLEYRRRQV